MVFVVMFVEKSLIKQKLILRLFLFFGLIIWCYRRWTKDRKVIFLTVKLFR